MLNGGGAGRFPYMIPTCKAEVNGSRDPGPAANFFRVFTQMFLPQKASCDHHFKTITPPLNTSDDPPLLFFCHRENGIRDSYFTLINHVCKHSSDSVLKIVILREGLT